MKHLDLLAFTDKLTSLRAISSICKETTNGASYSGEFNLRVKNILEDLKQIIIQHDISSLYIKIDDMDENWKDVSFNHHISKWSLSIGNKKELLELAGMISSDIESFLFFDNNYFNDEWLQESSNLQQLNSKKPKKIFVYGLRYMFGGPRIALIPLNKSKEELPSAWLKSTKLPDPEKIHKTVHFITSDQNDFSLENLLITWGEVDNKQAQIFHIASAKALICSLVQEYYNDQKVILNGKKRLEIKLLDKDENLDFINKKNIDKLCDIVAWCYEKEDEKTRILLLVDRLTLDINQEKALMHIIPTIIEKAYIEAESRYKYVILDRKIEYTKELADLQKDISNIADKYATSTNNYTTGLLKDILAFASILTVGVIAKKFIDEKLLFSPEAELLFRAFAIYLFISFFLRILHFTVVVYQFEKLTISWKEIVRNHMSAKELKLYVNTALKSVKRTFLLIAFIVSIIYIAMSLASWNSTYILNSMIYPNNTIEKQDNNSTKKYIDSNCSSHTL